MRLWNPPLRKKIRKHIPKDVDKLETSLTVISKSLINEGLNDIKETVFEETIKSK